MLAVAHQAMASADPSGLPPLIATSAFYVVVVAHSEPFLARMREYAYKRGVFL